MASPQERRNYADQARQIAESIVVKEGIDCRDILYRLAKAVEDRDDELAAGLYRKLPYAITKGSRPGPLPPPPDDDE